LHEAALAHMAEALDRYGAGYADALDVGSLDVNGTYRDLIESRGWQYTGLDTQPGANVDIVAPEPFSYPVADASYDIVLSGSTAEHVTALWLWMPELVRCLRPGGLLAILTHWQFVEHRYPLDCWRIMPDGMAFLFDQSRQLTDYDIRIVSDTDIFRAVEESGWGPDY